MTRPAFTALVALPLLLPALTAAVPGCGGAQKARSQDTELRGELTELRAERRRQRQKMRDLENELLAVQQKVDSGDSLAPPELPVEVIAPHGDDTPVHEAPTYHRRDDGIYRPAPRNVPPAQPIEQSEITYVGEAAENKTVKVTPRLLREAGISTLDAQPTYTRKPSPAAASRKRTALAPVPTVAAPAAELGVTRGRLPTVRSVSSRPVAKVNESAIPSPPIVIRQARPAAPRPAADSGEGPKELYARHYRALRAGDHAAAVAGFRQFVRKYPTHDYADNALYWLGESFYHHKRFADALREFERVLARYPRANKVPDAMLKIAYCKISLGQRDSAARALRLLTVKFPKSNPARLAEEKLRQLGQ